MCGIVGTYGPDAATRTDGLLRHIGHRGPDGRGLWSEGPVTFGHARLAILDPTERSDQPFSRDSRTLIYNGEIYNHVELRRELEAAGAAFTTTGDTEVLLTILEVWGVAGLDRIEGMFAFAMWNSRDKSLLLARDRHGIKPLYWQAGYDGSISFSSELTPLADASGRDIDSRAVREFLRFGSPVTTSIAHGVVEVAPGTTMRIAGRPGSASIDTATFAGDRPHIDGTAVEAIRRSIEQHSRSDRATALFLSGGFDSAAILAGLARIDAAPLCLTLATEHNGEEVERARQTAKRYGANHEVVSVDETTLATSIESYLRSMDQPTVDGFNTYLISEVSRRFSCPVALSGLGGDEVLGGYRYYRAEDLLQRFEPTLSRVPPRLRSLAAHGASRVLKRSPARLHELVESSSTAARHRAFRALFSDVEVAELTGHRPSQSIRWDVDPLADARRQLAQLDRSAYLRPTLLRDSDVFSMWHGIELRVPFVDTRVIDSVLAEGRPPTKHELATAWGDDFLVEKALQPKLTFRLPWDRWLASITDSSSEVLSSSDPWQGLIDPNLARSIIDHAPRRKAEPLRPWSVLVLARWLALRGEPRISPTADIALSDRSLTDSTANRTMDTR